MVQDCAWPVCWHCCFLVEVLGGSLGSHQQQLCCCLVGCFFSLCWWAAEAACFSQARAVVTQLLFCGVVLAERAACTRGGAALSVVSVINLQSAEQRVECGTCQSCGACTQVSSTCTASTCTEGERQSGRHSTQLSPNGPLGGWLRTTPRHSMLRCPAYPSVYATHSIYFYYVVPVCRVAMRALRTCEYLQSSPVCVVVLSFLVGVVSILYLHKGTKFTSHMVEGSHARADAPVRHLCSCTADLVCMHQAASTLVCACLLRGCCCTTCRPVLACLSPAASATYVSRGGVALPAVCVLWWLIRSACVIVCTCRSLAEMQCHRRGYKTC